MAAAAGAGRDLKVNGRIPESGFVLNDEEEWLDVEAFRIAEEEGLDIDKIMEKLRKYSNIAILGFGREGKSTYNFIRKYDKDLKLTILDKVYFVGINTGTLGFFYDFKEEDISHLFETLEKEQYSIEQHQLLECDLGTKAFYAVNEVRFENPFHTLVCSVKVNDIELERFHGNGLLVCSSLGSTAYNKSLGGAVMSRNTDLLQLTEISTIQNNIYRSLGSSLVLNKDAVITFEGDFTGVVIGYDHLNTNFDSNMMKVHLSNKKVTIIYPKDFNYLKPIKRSFIK